MKRASYALVLITFLLVLPACQNNDKNAAGAAVEIDEKKPIEIVLTKEEESQIQSWTGKPVDKMAAASMNGDIGAMYWLGLIWLVGGAGLAIDTANANIQFAEAATLGFAPALDKIRAMYMDTYNDPFLTLVYVNLVVSFGHLEFAKAYHKNRASMIEAFGLPVVQEVERLAAHKKAKILNNRESFKKANDKMEFVFRVGCITDEDVLFDMDYWQKAIKGGAPKNLDQWIIENYDTIVKKAAQKARECQNRLAAYKDSIEESTEESSVATRDTRL